MMYTARHRRAPIRRAWDRLGRPVSWAEMAGAYVAVGILAALMTWIALVQ